VPRSIHGHRVGRIAPPSAPTSRRAETRAPDLLALAASHAAVGDPTAIRFLLVRLADDVHARVLGSLGDPVRAGAVTESVFTELPHTIQSYDPSEMPFDAWLLGVADRAASARPAVAPEAEGSPEGRDALWSLPPDVRYVIVLRHLVGLSTSAIAARLGKTDAAVKRLDQRGRAAFRARRRRGAQRSAVA
jgi:DNA-directed RNA polymerase specialized sigma24 family protein